MSIIEKALDKALGRPEGDTVAESRPLREPPVERTKEALPVDESITPPESFAPEPVDAIAEVETSEADEGPVHDLDWQQLRDHGFLKPGEDNAMTEVYRRIARPVLFNAFPAGNSRLQRANLAMLTSSRSDEGKTFAAVNLALGIAADQPERKVLLIDADLEQRSLSRLFGLVDRGGLTELLENAAESIRDRAVRTSLAKLRILPAGSVTKNPSDLLTGPAMLKLVRELADRHADEMVILDAPSLLEMEGVANLATQVGQVLLVIESDRTPQVIVRKSVAKLEFCNVVGCILNKAAEPPPVADLAVGYGLYTSSGGGR